MTRRRRLPPGAKWVTLPSGAKRVEIVLDAGQDPATGKRRQVRRRFRTEDEAKSAYTTMAAEVQAGTFTHRSAKTVESVCEEWLKGRRVRPATKANYTDVLKPVVAAYGQMSVQQLTKAHVDELMTALSVGGLLKSNGRPRKPWSARSVNLMVTVLQMVLDDALRQGFVARNVAALVDRLEQTKPEMQTFTEAEVKRVLAAAAEDGRYEIAWHLALSGLRRGEICGLKWQDVDLDAGMVTIRRARIMVDSEVQEALPKSRSGERTLPLPDSLRGVLRRARKVQAEDRLRLPSGDYYVEGDYVLADEAGAPIHPETVGFRWHKMLDSAGVRHIRLHDARHTCGTLMHLRGVPVAVIAAWLGHKDASFTMRTYVHSQDDALRSAAAAVSVVTSA
ncbi:MAG: site-specific integrase [Acidobacteria bacterium]|nr:MAG: site-specific integrase [Acidobacteriota bacterium]